MPFDALMSPTVPGGLVNYKTSSYPLIQAARPMDVVFAPQSFQHEALVVGSGGCAIHTLVAREVTVSGNDISALLESAETDRLRPSELTGANFSAGAVTSDKLSAPVPVAFGGTGVDSTSVPEGCVAVGAGTAPISFRTSLSWSDASSTLCVDSSVRIEEFELSASNGSLFASGPGVSVDLLDYSLGIAPVARLLPRAGPLFETQAVVDFEVVRGDMPAARLHLAWYPEDTDQPRLPHEVAKGVGAMSSDTIDLQSSGLVGSYTVANLAPLTRYVVRATAVDERGIASAVHPVSVRTTELSSPVVAAIDKYVTSPNSVGFSVSNQPDSSPMRLVAGILTTGTPVTRDVIDANSGLFVIRTIPAMTTTEFQFTFATAHDPDNSFAPEPVREARTYHPFVLYTDMESNFTLAYGNPLFNPDVTAPVFLRPLEFVSATGSSITVSHELFDAVGLTDVRAYVSLLDGSGSPALQDVLARGAVVSASGPSTITNYHSPDGLAKPLVDTARYRVHVAATDAAGLTVTAHVDANTLDDRPPLIDSFSVSGVANTGDASITWSASDPGPHGAVTAVHVLATSLTSVLGAEQVRASATASFAQASGSTTITNIPAYFDTVVHAVAEDGAASFGNGANRLSSVARGVIPVPVVNSSIVEFSQDPASSDVRLAFVPDGITAAVGPVVVRLVLIDTSYPFTPSERNAVFSDDVRSATLSNLLFGAEAYSQETVVS
jgi:hypothetical protein